LEFFIPQLCSFFLNPEISSSSEAQLLDLLTKACSINFFFAHRVYFFFNSCRDYLAD